MQSSEAARACGAASTAEVSVGAALFCLRTRRAARTRGHGQPCWGCAAVTGLRVLHALIHSLVGSLANLHGNPMCTIKL